MVWSHLDYCCTIWNPHQRDQKYEIKMVQRRAARFVTNRCRNASSVTDMLDYLGWESHDKKKQTVADCSLQNRAWTYWHQIFRIIDAGKLQDEIVPRSQIPVVLYINWLLQLQPFPKDNTSVDQTTSSCSWGSFGILQERAIWPHLLMGRFPPGHERTSKWQV